MKTAAECWAYAEQCRTLAVSMSGDHRHQTLNMAAIWESLAREAEAKKSDGALEAEQAQPKR